MLNPLVQVQKYRRGWMVIGVLLALGGCEKGGVTITAATPNANSESITTGVNRDVERPDIFSTSENALWDGRPSLGGVWVAYPSTTDPERVIIRNLDNGKSVIGALFRRERDIPGPKIQLSSDAATALGIIAGTPTEISIVVLRREEVQIDVPDPTPEATPEPDPEVTPEATPEPVVEPTPIEVAPVAATPAPVDIDTLVKDVLSSTPNVADTLAGPALAVTPVVETVVAPSGNAPRKPFIQVGTFSSRDRAEALVAILAGSNVPSEIRANDDETLFRVVSGPAATRAERNARLRIIRGLGFSDAFTFR